MTDATSPSFDENDVHPDLGASGADITESDDPATEAGVSTPSPDQV